MRAEAAYQAAVADPATAGPVAEAVAAEARRAGNVEAEVVALRAQAWCAVRAQLAEERARRLLNRAARLAEAAGLDERLAEVLVVRSAVNEELGATRSAERDLLRARRLLGDKAPPALEQQTAVMHQNAGRIAEAAAIYRKTLKRRDLPVDIRAKMSNNLAMIEAQLGRYGVALALTGRARALAEEVGPFLTGDFAEGEALVLAQAGRLPESLALFEEAERLFEVAGLPLGELHAEAADAMLDLRLLPEARVAADRALREFIEADVPLMRAEAQLRVARVALLAGDAAAATAESRRAVEAFRQQRRTGWAARSAVVGGRGPHRRGDRHPRRPPGGTPGGRHAGAARADRPGGRRALTAGRTATLLGRDAWAKASFGRAHELARGSSVLTRLKGRLAAASAATLRGEPAVAVRHCRQGLADLDRHRGQLASTELRVLASAHGVELGQLALRDAAGDLVAGEGVRLDGAQPGDRPPVGAARRCGRLRRGVRAAARDDGGHRCRRRCVCGARRAARCARAATPTPDVGEALAERTAGRDASRPGTCRRCSGIASSCEYGVLDGEVLAAVVTGTRVEVVERCPRGGRARGAATRSGSCSARSCAAPDSRRSQARPARPRAGCTASAGSWSSRSACRPTRTWSSCPSTSCRASRGRHWSTRRCP